MLSFLCLLILLSAPLARGQDTISLSTTFYSPQEVQVTQDPDGYQYYRVTECAGSNADYDEIKLSIVDPGNLGFEDKSKKAVFVFVEVSKCAKQWNTACSIATNYNYNPDDVGGNVYPEIAWYRNQSSLNDSTFYMRFRASQNDAYFTFQLEYVTNENIIETSFNNLQFDVPTISDTSIYQSVNQLVRSTNQYSLNSGNYTYFDVVFCQQSTASKSLSSNVNALEISVIGTPDAPLSGFDLVACPLKTPKDDCNTGQQDKSLAIKDDSASFFATVTMYASEFDIYDGVQVYVLGYGGTPTVPNKYLLSILAIMNDD